VTRINRERQGSVVLFLVFAKTDLKPQSIRPICFEVSGHPQFLRPLRILLVEDDAGMRGGLNRLVNGLGHRTHITQNMREALDLAIVGNQTFDLLLSDINLPDGDGWELLQRLRDSGRRPWRAIAMSGQCSMEDLARSREAGFFHHLCKPVEDAVLEAILREATEEAPQ
jgi:CheY-like chemotaxis protein